MATMLWDEDDGGCEYAELSRPENAWLHAVIAVAFFKVFVHFVWAHEIMCSPEEKKKRKWRNWTLSAIMSFVSTYLAPEPRTPEGFFIALEYLYVPLAIKIVEYQTFMFG